MDILLSTFDVVARAGGGGSGGSSGGGGGMGVGSYLLYVIFYYPIYKLSDALRQKLEFWQALIISTFISVLYGGVTFFYLFINDAGLLMALLPPMFIVNGLVIGLMGVRTKFMKRIRVAQARRRTALQNDVSWQDNALVEMVADTFYQFQDDWSSMNVHNMRTYLHPGYWYHIELMLRALRLRDRKSVV